MSDLYYIPEIHFLKGEREKTERKVKEENSEGKLDEQDKELAVFII